MILEVLQNKFHNYFVSKPWTTGCEIPWPSGTRPKKGIIDIVDEIHKMLQNSTDLMGRSMFTNWPSTQLPN